MSVVDHESNQHADNETTAAATTPVESIAGPVFLLSGGADRI
ncbi:hypothetical protein [Halobiforma nitratireducens]|nr:hypothetical protein [Halobiforma nitratireducens]